MSYSRCAAVVFREKRRPLSSDVDVLVRDGPNLVVYSFFSVVSLICITIISKMIRPRTGAVCVSLLDLKRHAHRPRVSIDPLRRRPPRHRPEAVQWQRIKLGGDTPH